MRIPDDQKRQQIVAVAAQLFATQRFDQVRLDDVAAAAGVGKGTLYIYFPSKEDLYLSIVTEGLGQLVQAMREDLDPARPASQRLRMIVTGLVRYALGNPQVFELIRRGGPPAKDSGLRQQSRELQGLIEQTIVDGNARGEFADPNPHLTALFVPGFVRSVVVHGQRKVDEAELVEHILHLLQRGIASEHNEMRKRDVG